MKSNFNFRMPSFGTSSSFASKFQRRKRMMMIAFIVTIVLVIGLTVARPLTKTEVIAKVTDKERVTDFDSKTSKYLIFTDQETFECTDETIYLKFNSSDVYGQIKKENTYKFTVVGWRIPFFSTYRNIIKVEKME